MVSKSVAKKLFIKEGYTILPVNAPDEYKNLIGKLPQGARIASSASDSVNFIHLFVRSKDELQEHLEPLLSFVKSGSFLWISYPKGTSKVKTDINRDSIWAFSKTLGIRPVSQISIDETWSAMRFKLLEE
ncbi:MAG: hypothetical protein ACFFD6_01820 [Candidatus Thorarchaeota archaeon]